MTVTLRTLTNSGATTKGADLDHDELDGNFLITRSTGVARTLHSKLTEIEVSLTDFGTIGNSSTGDDAVWQLALDYLSDLPAASGVQGTLVIPQATTYLASQKKIGPNTTIKGKGLRFASQVIPLASFSGTSLFEINGADVTGGDNFYVNFKDFLIDETNIDSSDCPIVFYFDHAYSCKIEDVYIRNGVGKGVVVNSNCQDIKIITPHFFGLSTAAFTHGIHAVESCDVTIIDPDLEVCGVGIQQDGDSKVTVLGGYHERCSRGWLNNGNTSGSMTVIGGEWNGTNAGTTVAEARTGNCTVVGGHYIANGGNGLSVGISGTKPPNVHFLGVSGDITDAKNWATTNGKTDVSGAHKTVVSNRKQVSDNVATTLFTVTVPNAAANFGFVDVDIYAKITGVGLSIWTGRYRVGFAVSGGAIQDTGVTEYAKANADKSANYTLAVTMSVANSLPSLDIQITANSGGALGAGVAVDVIAEATLWQGISTGAVYITAA